MKTTLRLPTFSAVGLALWVPTLQAAESRVEPLSVGSVFSVLSGLALVVGLLFAAAWMVRRLQQVQAPAQGTIQVTAQLPLGLKERVLLLRVGEENILVGCTPGTIRTLHVWSGAAPQAGQGVAAAGQPLFIDHIKALLAEKGLGRGARPSAGERP